MGDKMGDITNIVNVEINLSVVSAIRSVNYNLPLILGAHTVFNDLYRIYTSPKQMLEDGFRIDSNEFKAASLMFSFDNPVPQIYVGRRLVSEVIAKVDKLKANYIYKVTIGEVQYTYTKATTPTALEVAAGLASAMTADPIVNVDDNLDGTYTITPKVAGTPFIFKIDNYQLFDTITTGQDILDDINAIYAEVNDWYGIVETLRVTSEVLDLAEWCETYNKLFITPSNDVNILEAVDDDQTSIAAIFYQNQYKFSTCIYHAVLNDFIDAAWMGNGLRKDAGAATWALKNLPSINTDDFTDIQRQNMIAKGCNFYEYVGGNGITNYGTVPNGDYLYIDVVRDTEYLKTDIEVSLFQLLIDNDKIPYTDSGIAICENILKKRLANAVAMGILTSNPSPTTSVPLAANISALDKQSRILRNLNFNAELANAIQQIQIVGTITY
jgi:hypothetical protein